MQLTEPPSTANSLMTAADDGARIVPVASGSGVRRGADLLAVSFGTTVAMWAVGYIARFPGVGAPSWLLLGMLLICFLTGGYVAGRWSDRGARGGTLTGLIAAALNLLILGSLLGGEQPGQVAPSALLWLPGSLIVGAAFGTLGGVLGSRSSQQFPAGAADTPPLQRQASALFGGVAATATFLLLIAGGIVTGAEAGLAVVDWPNSYGYNMFLYPLSRMTGGIYYEHAHRLLGSLVGLTTLVLAIHLWRSDHRPWLRRLAVIALVLVIGQGLLGGLRVTGHFTLSDDPEITRPQIWLAVIHGVLGQVFFGTLIAITVASTQAWRQAGPPTIRPAAATELGLTRVFVSLVIAQLVLGAILRHVAGGLLFHISLAMVVIVTGLAVGIRAWHPPMPSAILGRLGRTLLILLALQLLLGVSATVVTGIDRLPGAPPPADVALTTAHQAVGALLLACAVSITLWMHRLQRPAST